MRRTLATTAATALLLAAGLTACSSSSPTSDSKPKPAAASPSKSQAGDPVKYLYDVDEHRRSRSDVEGLVQHLQSRCTDSALVVEFTATSTATDLVDTDHDHQDVYPVLSRLVTSLPKGSGKVDCVSRLSVVEQQIKAQRAPSPSPTPTHRGAAAPTFAPAANAPGDATALCNDGTFSYSQHHHQATCSHHQGVAVWYE
ncbi:DUF3761 domain-containing protein [Streptomyces carpinensis]|uniref:DUF3761 domain-containing protein n=1 Tax=Streptomyces carpinensis TaxID=66369 RepID=A0ABV1W407_9ACTN|nr:DUF3761 domain-containing protein [Streptomyces carpinensis]